MNVFCFPRLCRLLLASLLLAGLPLAAAADTITLSFANLSGFVTAQTFTSGTQTGIEFTITSTDPTVALSNFGFNAQSGGNLIDLSLQSVSANLSADPTVTVFNYGATGQITDFAPYGFFDYEFVSANLGSTFSFSVLASDGITNLALANIILNSQTTAADPSWVPVYCSGTCGPSVFAASTLDGPLGSVYETGPATVPEPASLILLGSGLLAVGYVVRKFAGTS